MEAIELQENICYGFATRPDAVSSKKKDPVIKNVISSRPLIFALIIIVVLGSITCASVATAVWSISQDKDVNTETCNCTGANVGINNLMTSLKKVNFSWLQSEVTEPPRRFFKYCPFGSKSHQYFRIINESFIWAIAHLPCCFVFPHLVAVSLLSLWLLLGEVFHWLNCPCLL